MMSDLAKAAQEELARRVSDDPLALWYRPYENQKKFHEARASVTVQVGGNRAGKTVAAVAEALFYCLARPVYAPVPNPPTTVWYIMPSLTMFRRSVLPVFRRLVPWGSVKDYSRKDNVVTFFNGSELHFLSSDMRAGRLQGAAIDLAIMDETPDETVFNEVLARVLDRQGRVILVFSPVEVKSYWVREKLYLPWQAGERPDVQFLFAPVADKDGNPLVPHFTKEQIQEMLARWPDAATRAARIYGEFALRFGNVFSRFDPGLHVIPPFDIPDSWGRWLVCDPQYHRFAVLYFAGDDQGGYFVTDEYFSQDEPLATRAERMARMVGSPDRAIPCYVDYAVPQDIAELNWHFTRLGAPIGACPIPFPKKTEDFLLTVQALLEPVDDRLFPPGVFPQPVYGAPRLLFFQTLCSKWVLNQRELRTSRLLWELQRYSWGKDGRPDKASADGADMMDALLYGCAIPSSGRPLHAEAPEEPFERRLMRQLLRVGPHHGDDLY
jgi:hypothetical protein